MIQGFILSMQFLTRVPINIPIDFNDKNIRNSTFFYPFVGMILGVLCAIPYYFLNSFNKDIASFLTVVLMIIFTGGLHLDGLSDTVDGFFSNRDRERTLEIMKDSRVGSFGVLSLILIILFKYIIISSMETNIVDAIILSMGNGRLIVLIQIALKKVARPGGLGDMLHRTNPKKQIVGGSFIYILIISYINIGYLIPLLVSFILGELISKYTYKKIGGFTGDVYGATIELTEAISLLTFWGVSLWT
ncbi:adenosylcobinamide-GDP ribazoletransferase [Wansuia hejianensis]|uniref:Adenosylcobinamide-GDP ribazoletransferase n=1 Tax=Wansuia hejianensis TaxID=2763667 RepID=A0A926F114_9FIRM|nr:adenosylcobinamide-GDP ribazoletransferase [Wansuia hejianensis]MBC8591396.1 adenosylcobinamide-GDP ribazoletransferase [Wansuia hejianensis]